MSMPPNLVCIRGVTYISQAAAARALGVAPSAISIALDEGRIDTVGLRLKSGGHPGRPCWYRGKRYPSRTAAARACGVSVAAVSKAVKAAANSMWEMAA